LSLLQAELTILFIFSVYPDYSHTFDIIWAILMLNKYIYTVNGLFSKWRPFQVKPEANTKKEEKKGGEM